MTPHLLSIVNQNLGADAQKLSLSLSDFSVEDRAWIVNQIESRKKLKTKIKAWQKAEIVFPHELAIEQCSSELTARFKAQIFPKQNKVLDLTMGLGVDSYFFSRYHTHVTATEPNFHAYESAKHNFKQLNVDNIKILNQSAEDFLLTNQDHFDLVFIDPSRRNEKGGKVFGISDCQPNMIELLPKLSKITEKIIIKLSPMLDVSKAIEDLNRLFDIYAVSVMNDCKELLLVIQHSKEAHTLNALELASETSRMLTCDLGNEKEKAILGIPEKFLYLPHSSVLKLALQDYEALKLGMKKLAPHSHVYTSENLITDYMGRIFSILAVISPNEKELKAVIPDSKISLLAKNFPLKTEDLKKKLKTKESDQFFGLACTMFNGDKKLIVCERLLSD